MTEEKTDFIVMINLPWFDPAGDLFYETMRLQSPGPVDRRTAFKAMRKWYKKEIGQTVDNEMLRELWKRRHETRAMTEQKVQELIHQLAIGDYAKIKKESDSNAQEDVAGGTEQELRDVPDKSSEHGDA